MILRAFMYLVEPNRSTDFWALARMTISTNRYALLIITMITSLCYPHSAAANQEDKLRAAVIGGILRYTQWQDSDPKMLCSLGTPSSEGILFKSAHRVRANKQAISILKVKSPEQIKSCQIIVIGKVADILAPALQAQLNSGDTLSICDGCKENLWATSITLIRHKNNIRFDVDLTNTGKDAITFSASLLELALNIKGQNNE